MTEFVGAGKAPGIEIWRIENMVPVKLPELDGKLYEGDSYILLSTTQPPNGGALSWHLHFWLGKDTSQDESGVAAYKSVELDESLGGGPTQHRECQAHESDLFLSYFKKVGLEYVPGGVASGFSKVERDVFRTRLLRLKGKRTVRVAEVPCEAASLNTGDVFVLDMGLALFLFSGDKANKHEKGKGAALVHRLHDERGARGRVTLVDEDDPDCAAFWDALGGQIQVTAPGEDDEKAAAAALEEIKLFHISDSSGGVSMDEVPRDAQGHYTRAMLCSQDAYVLDAGATVFLWTGKHASAEEKKEAVHIATSFIEAQGRPHYTQVERNNESGETAMFKSFFHAFDPPLTPAAMKAALAEAARGTVAGPTEEQRIDFRQLAAARKAATPVDDGSGKVEVWRIEDFKKVPVDPAKYGQFYGGDSYLVLYTYTCPRGREAQIIYFWQGHESSADEVGASALLAKELDDALGGSPVQVRVVQGKEPLHFRSLFKGSMVVHSGGKASGFKNRSGEGDSYDDDGVGLFHVKGTTASDVVGVQTAEVAASLNSMDAFVLVTPATVFCWAGRSALPEEVAAATRIADALALHSYGPPGTAPPPNRATEAVAEGEEPEAFWAALGGQGEYAATPPGAPLPSEPRLFQCTDRLGAFAVAEVSGFFDQSDLLDDDVMLLDVGTATYVWVGHAASEAERAKALDAAAQYNAAAADGRDPGCPVMQVAAGHEPLLFTQFFPSWDPALHDKQTYVDPYEAKRTALKAAAAQAEEKRAAEAAAAAQAASAARVAAAEKAAAARTAEKAAKAAAPPPAPSAAPSSAPERRGTVTGKSLLTPPSGGFLDPSANPFDYATLSTGLPAGVDPVAKEQYLPDGDFEQRFGMTKADFLGLALWKRNAKKRETKLF